MRLQGARTLLGSSTPVGMMERLSLALRSSELPAAIGQLLSAVTWQPTSDVIAREKLLYGTTRYFRDR